MPSQTSQSWWIVLFRSARDVFEIGREMVNQKPAPESSNYFHPVLLRKCVCKRLQEPSIFLTVCWVSFCALVWETIVGYPSPQMTSLHICRSVQRKPTDRVPHFLVCLCPSFWICRPSPSQSVSPPCFCLLSLLRLPCRWFFVDASQRGWGQCGLTQTHKPHHINLLFALLAERYGTYFTCTKRAS